MRDYTLTRRQRQNSRLLVNSTWVNDHIGEYGLGQTGNETERKRERKRDRDRDRDTNRKTERQRVQIQAVRTRYIENRPWCMVVSGYVYM